MAAPMSGPPALQCRCLIFLADSNTLGLARRVNPGRPSAEPSLRHAPGGRSVPELCPGCRQIDGVEQTSRTPRVAARKCRCGMAWAISPFDVAEHLLSEPGFLPMLHNGAARRRRPDRVLRSPQVGRRGRVPSRVETSRSVTTSSRPTFAQPRSCSAARSRCSRGAGSAGRGSRVAITQAWLGRAGRALGSRGS